VDRLKTNLPYFPVKWDTLSRNPTIELKTGLLVIRYLAR